MKAEYDLSKMKSRRNPYASKLKKPNLPRQPQIGNEVLRLADFYPGERRMQRISCSSVHLATVAFARQGYDDSRGHHGTKHQREAGMVGSGIV